MDKKFVLCGKEIIVYDLYLKKKKNLGKFYVVLFEIIVLV